MKAIRRTSQRITDEGEFTTPEDVAAWIAGSVIALQDAKEILITVVAKSGRPDQNAPGSFLWRGPNRWEVEVEARWPEVQEDIAPPAAIDVTRVRDTLYGVRP